MKFNIPSQVRNATDKSFHLRNWKEGTEAIITRHGKSEYQFHELESFENCLTGYKPKP